MEKYLNKLFLLAVSGIFFLSACTKEGTNVTYTSGNAPVLSANVTTSIPLSYANAANQAVIFSWTNPDYQLSNGVSSLNVSYNLQFDTVGANFTSPNMKTVTISPDLSVNFTVDQVNSIVANDMVLAIGVSHNIQVRVVAFLAPYTSGSPNIQPFTSNTLTFKVTPYTPPPKITPPASGTLFIVGSAVPVSGWNNPITGGAAQVASQQFTQVSPTLYTLTIALIGGGSYQFVPNNGNWTGQCGIAVKNDPSEVNGGSFVNSSSQDILGPAANGTYKIVVDFQHGTFTVTKQ